MKDDDDDQDDDEEKFIRYAEFYRKRIESKIDDPLVFVDGQSCRPPEWLRAVRAENLWRSVTGSDPPGDWAVDDIVVALVIRAFGHLVHKGGDGTGGNGEIG